MARGAHKAFADRYAADNIRMNNVLPGPDGVDAPDGLGVPE